MKILRSPSFWRDLQAITDYFIDVNAENTAERFSKELDATIDFISEFPDLSSPWESPDPELAELRYRSVKKFRRYVVVYHHLKSSVVILRIFHTSQNIEELLKE